MGNQFGHPRARRDVFVVVVIVVSLGRKDREEETIANETVPRRRFNVHLSLSRSVLGTNRLT